MYEYEKTVMKLYKDARYSPLMSWDISGQSLYGAINTGQELNSLKQFEKQYHWKFFPDVRIPLFEFKTIVLTNLNKEIMWVSNRFYNMTGYIPSEAIGRKPSFLQGKNTDIKKLTTINEKLTRLEVVKDSVINYRKNGEEYLCHLEIHPILNQEHQPVNFIAIEYADI